jgi:hypothetical protein
MNRPDYFDAFDDEGSAYWFGFFCADGCIFSSGKQAAITLAARDVEHLRRFASVFGRPVWETSVRDARTGETYERARCVLSSKHLCDALRAHQPYSSGKPLRAVREDVFNHFVRGYFDGDGHIGVVREIHWRVSFAGGAEFLSDLSARLRATLGLRQTKIRSDGAISRVTWGGVWQVRRIGEFMYRDATIFLERKCRLFCRVPDRRGSSRFVGVYRPSGRNRWVARIFADGKTRHIASCADESEAAKAYDAAARLYYGNAAMLNFPAPEAAS